MRRALSSLLIAIFSLPLIAQAFALNPATALPACCRRAGAHHCTMGDQGGSGEQLAQKRCPLYPQTGTITSNIRFTAPAVSAAIAAAQFFGFTTPAHHQPAPSVALPGSIRKRGPPSLLYSL